VALIGPQRGFVNFGLKSIVYWSNGVLECWSIGIDKNPVRFALKVISHVDLKKPNQGRTQSPVKGINPLLHHSSTPVLHYSFSSYIQA
jgi:hypothetical protein